MRVSMSEIGSLILMQFSPASLDSPAGLDDAGDFPAHRDFAKLVAAQTELPVRPARASGQSTTIAHPYRRRIARQPLELQPRFIAVFLRELRIVGGRSELRALRGVLLHLLAALVVAIDQCQLCHVYTQLLNGNLKAASSALASASDFAVVAIVMFIPLIASILSYSISGKMICSFTPML